MKTVFVIATISIYSSCVFADCAIEDVLQMVRPGQEWVVYGSSYNGLQWLDKTHPKPSAAEIQAGVSDCQAKASSRQALKSAARLDVKDKTLPTDKRFQALLILMDLDQ